MVRIFCERGILVQYFFHASAVLRPIVFGVPENVVWINFKAFCAMDTQFAILPAFSLPGIP